jgi:hypothetical protein
MRGGIYMNDAEEEWILKESAQKADGFLGEQRRRGGISWGVGSRKFAREHA